MRIIYKKSYILENYNGWIFFLTPITYLTIGSNLTTYNYERRKF